MPNEKTIDNIPKSKVAGVVKGFEDEGCETRTEEQSDGLWAVHATCPDKAEK